MTNTEKVNLAIQIMDDALDQDIGDPAATLAAVETVLRFGRDE